MATNEKRRKRYELRCPNKNCPYPGRYHYFISVFQRPENERCPICGYYGEILEFLLVVQCEICGEKFSGRESNEHKTKTGHNSWTLLVPKEER